MQFCAQITDAGCGLAGATVYLHANLFWWDGAETFLLLF